MIKDSGSKFVIIGHSEMRKEGDTDKKINMKIKSAINSNLHIIFCIGEKLNDKKRKKTNLVLKRQIKNGLKKIKKYENVIVAYEPVWSIGTGIIPKSSELTKNINFIRKVLKSKKIIKNIKILYGGSVNPGNVRVYQE